MFENISKGLRTNWCSCPGSPDVVVATRSAIPLKKKVNEPPRTRAVPLPRSLATQKLKPPRMYGYEYEAINVTIMARDTFVIFWQVKDKVDWCVWLLPCNNFSRKANDKKGPRQWTKRQTQTTLENGGYGLLLAKCFGRESMKKKEST
ncbi:hypothetical protein Tco_1110605 [Tanacetum coccineum]|uniref:Uncharacterized protein n=1 Tax=Tanacetum coccineum TaxID=301880 RepID=A0ABQ5IJB9_9ASTR